MAAARIVVGQLGAVVLIEGPTTGSAAPDGQTVVQDEGGPELVTAGGGDTLAGVRFTLDGPFGASVLALAVRAVLVRDG